MNEVKVFIADSECATLNKLSAIVEDHCDTLITGTSSQLPETLEKIDRYSPDLLFCDIHLSGKNGLELVSGLKTVYPKMETVIICPRDMGAVEFVRKAKLDYIVKPPETAQVFQKIDQIHKKNYLETLSPDLQLLVGELRKNQKIRFNNVNGFVLIKPSDIYYAEADGNYSRLHLTDGSIETISQNLRCLESKLSSFSFVRLSRFYLLNLEYLAGFDRKRKVCYIKHAENVLTLPVPAERIREIDRVLS